MRMGLRGSPLGFRREHVVLVLGCSPAGTSQYTSLLLILESCLSAVAPQEPEEDLVVVFEKGHGTLPVPL